MRAQLLNLRDADPRGMIPPMGSNVCRHGRDFPALVRGYRDLQDTGDPVHMWPL